MKLFYFINTVFMGMILTGFNLANAQDDILEVNAYYIEKHPQLKEYLAQNFDSKKKYFKYFEAKAPINNQLFFHQYEALHEYFKANPGNPNQVIHFRQYSQFTKFDPNRNKLLHQFGFLVGSKMAILELIPKFPKTHFVYAGINNEQSDVFYYAPQWTKQIQIEDESILVPDDFECRTWLPKFTTLNQTKKKGIIDVNTKEMLGFAINFTRHFDYYRETEFKKLPLIKLGKFCLTIGNEECAQLAVGALILKHKNLLLDKRDNRYFLKRDPIILNDYLLNGPKECNNYELAEQGDFNKTSFFDPEFYPITRKIFIGIQELDKIDFLLELNGCIGGGFSAHQLLKMERSSNYDLILLKDLHQLLPHFQKFCIDKIKGLNKIKHFIISDSKINNNVLDYLCYTLENHTQCKDLELELIKSIDYNCANVSFSKLQKIKSLFLTLENDYLPPSMQNITKLSLNFTNPELPYNVDLIAINFPNLKTLFLYSHRLCQIPVNFSGLNNLKDLHINFYDLSLIDFTPLKDLKCLKKLTIEFSQGEIPESLSLLIPLETLEIKNNNGLTLIPANFENLQNLKELWIRCNQNLEYFNPDVEKMQNLKHIYTFSSPICYSHDPKLNKIMCE